MQLAWELNMENQDLNERLKAYENIDPTEMFENFKREAEEGFPPSQWALGFCYKDGKGTPQDYTEAVKWFRLAAEWGYPDAQSALGEMYEMGNGLRQDYSKAIKWYRLSAAQGHAYAQCVLGLLYAHGKGVLKDNLVAHMWLNISSANGDESAGKIRDELASKMTHGAIEKATIMARECMDSNYKNCNF